MTRRDLAWDGCLNVRDLGGLALDGGTVAPGALVRGDCVAKLSASGWDALRAHGIRTVIDLRARDEAERVPVRAPSGIRCVGVPIVDAVPAEEAAEPPAWPTIYPMMLDRYRSGFAAAVTAIVEAGPGGVLVQCHLGRDRTGIVVALALALAGADEATIRDDYEASRARLDDARMTAWQRSQPTGLLDDALAHLRAAHGGAARYVTAGGAPPDIAGRVRARLVGQAARSPE